MNREPFKKRLAREAREYLADLRNFGKSLQRTEGWVTLGLIIAVLLMLVEWFVTGMGFDRLNDLSGSFSIWRPRLCRPLDDFAAILLVLDAIALVLLGAMAIGEMMQLLDRRRSHLPTRPRQVALPAGAMLVVGLAGIGYMRYLC
ncbi:MAG: hypothetical protein JSR19_08830 [Proteobacteria bacterium]|nr:hypothetical protein [Pseudomonadota bacterium]HQR04449.1 hypothetical protein [Rhodocyclaceae bacterium]